MQNVKYEKIALVLKPAHFLPRPGSNADTPTSCKNIFPFCFRDFDLWENFSMQQSSNCGCRYFFSPQLQVWHSLKNNPSKLSKDGVSQQIISWFHLAINNLLEKCQNGKNWIPRIIFCLETPKKLFCHSWFFKDSLLYHYRSFLTELLGIAERILGYHHAHSLNIKLCNFSHRAVGESLSFY